MDENIRIATIEDLPAIDAIYNHAIAARFQTADLTPISAARRLEWFNAHDPARYPVFVYERAAQVVGWLSLSAYRPGRQALEETAELSYYVHASHQHEGIGSRLLAHAIQESRRMGKRVLFAVVIEGNAASLGLLQKFGFEPWGRLYQVIACFGEVRDQIYLGLLL